MIIFIFEKQINFVICWRTCRRAFIDFPTSHITVYYSCLYFNQWLLYRLLENSFSFLHYYESGTSHMHRRNKILTPAKIGKVSKKMHRKMLYLLQKCQNCITILPQKWQREWQVGTATHPIINEITITVFTFL